MIFAFSLFERGEYDNILKRDCSVVGCGEIKGVFVLFSTVALSPSFRP